MNKNILKHAATFLRMAADEFGNHGCNDYDLENTDENWQLIQDYQEWNGEEEEFWLTRPPLDKPISFFDFGLMSYISHIMDEESKK